MSIDILSSNSWWSWGYRRLSHTVLSGIVSCVRISEQDVWCWWLISTDLGNCVLKPVVIKWPVKLCVRVLRVFTFFFKIQKTDFLRFFELLRTFSRTLSADTTVVSFNHTCCKVPPSWGTFTTKVKVPLRSLKRSAWRHRDHSALPHSRPNFRYVILSCSTVLLVESAR